MPWTHVLDVPHVHSSGRYTQSPKQLKAMIRSFDHLNPAAITLTETDPAARAAVLHKLPGYQAHTHPHGAPVTDDTAVVWPFPGWKLIHAETITTTSKVFPQGARTIHGQCASVVVLEHIYTGVRVGWSVAHVPHNIERGDRILTRTLAGLAWLDALRRWGRQSHDIAKRFGCVALFRTGDFNADHKRPAIRAVIRGIWPRMRCSWSPPFPKRGTHDTRFIDATWYRPLERGWGVRVAHAPHLLPHVASDDHTPYDETFALWKKAA